jgi:hypothetical protein
LIDEAKPRSQQPTYIQFHLLCRVDRMMNNVKADIAVIYTYMKPVQIKSE